MSSTLPKLVVALCTNFDAWIVGSAADPSNDNPRDIDVLVPIYSWGQACHLIPKNAKVNSLGGWKCFDDIEIDIWPGDLGWLMQSSRSKYAWHPRSGIRLQKV